MKKNAVGRPTDFKPDYVDQAAKLCRLGAIDRDLADFFNVSEVTINAWKKAKPEFLKSINDAKAQADAQVERSLFHRANGYSHPAVKIFNHDGNALTVPYMEHYAPDTGACIFWLKNRRPDLWRDKQEVEHSANKDAPPLFTLKIDNS
ncbi:helix-turn-helix domain-containing protein [Mesorhizobium sp. ES1-1]|uniref:helix-turn-helix domain-containing protein n=1 Tax=Mesorhizobium sp. ES1-1 TaxID=2876629 RepID=UPI001CCCCAE6|nr:helix-turn-helix domain-containing protein [Mesorhizobium sp. ES1-1]MBZ9674540.1 helix-turn-helix domain-containing protein [Mesorhizobium sp. ES1-1]